MNTQTETQFNFPNRIIVQERFRRDEKKERETARIIKTVPDSKPLPVVYRKESRRIPVGTMSITAMNLEEFIAYMDKSRLPTLKLRVEDREFKSLKSGYVGILKRNNNPYNKCRLIDEKENEREYVYVKVSSRTESIYFVYEGFFCSKSDHLVKFENERTIRISKGDFVLKLGDIITIE